MCQYNLVQLQTQLTQVLDESEQVLVGFSWTAAAAVVSEAEGRINSACTSGIFPLFDKTTDEILLWNDHNLKTVKQK